MRRPFTVLAILSALALAAPTAVWAQPNSPAGNQPSDSPPDTGAGGPSNQSGVNAGSDDVTGNRTTPGGAGATGGGAATETEPAGGGGGGAGKALVGVLVVLAIVGLVALVSITRRNRGAEQRLEAAGKA